MIKKNWTPSRICSLVCKCRINIYHAPNCRVPLKFFYFFFFFTLESCTHFSKYIRVFSSFWAPLYNLSNWQRRYAEHPLPPIRPLIVKVITGYSLQLFVCWPDWNRCGQGPIRRTLFCSSLLSHACVINSGPLCLFRSKFSNGVCFLLGNSPTSEFYMPTFRNTLSVPSS